MKIDVFGIGNPLIDIITGVSDSEIVKLKKNKGGMHLISFEEREEILNLIQSREIAYQCGGSAPNTMISLSHFGLKTALSGKVGKDEYGLKYISALENSGVISNIVQDNGPTGSSIILLTPDSERTMNTFLGVNRQYRKSDLDENLLLQSKYFYFTGYMWDTEEQKQAILRAIEICEENNIKIVFDVADPFAVNRNKNDFLDLIKQHVSILFANEQEAEMLCGSKNAEQNLAYFEEYTGIVNIKMGAKGSFTASGNKKNFLKITPIEAIDSTGAGDMYAAGFLFGLLKGKDAFKAAEYASFAASEIVKVKGAQFSEENYIRVSNRLNSI